MHYILDTGFFIIIRDYYPNAFPAFWEKMDQAVGSNLISSVKEVKKELEQYGGKQEHLLKWIKDHEKIFTNPTSEELNKVRQIFEVPEFQNLIDKKKRLGGGPCADPFVIAKAMKENAVLISREKPAARNKKGELQGSVKIPDVCKNFNIVCLSPEKFMEKEGWIF